MGALEAKALQLRFPNDIGRTANNFGWKKIAVTTTYGPETLLSEFRGREIWVLNPHATAIVHVALSLSSSAEVDAGAADGSTLKVGLPVPPSTLLRLGPLPVWDTTATAYLILDASANTSFYYGLGDGE